MEGLTVPTVLLYSVPADMHRAIAAIALELGADCKKIARWRFTQCIGCHAGIPGCEGTAARYEGQDLPSPMLIFAGFSDRMLDRFLAAYKKAAIPEIDYRAVVTKYNIGWNVLDLYQELVQEHESIRLRSQQPDEM